MYITHTLPIVDWLNYPLGVIAGVLKLKALCKLYIQSAQSNSPSSLCARARWICVRALSPMIELLIQHLNVSQAIQITNVTYWKQYYVIAIYKTVSRLTTWAAKENLCLVRALLPPVRSEFSSWLEKHCSLSFFDLSILGSYINPSQLAGCLHNCLLLIVMHNCIT